MQLVQQVVQRKLCRALIVLLLLVAADAIADPGAAVFDFEGLKVSCKSCRRVSNTDCEIYLGSELSLVSCETGIAKFLQERRAKRTELAEPSSDNIVAYLRRKQVAPGLAEQLLIRLLEADDRVAKLRAHGSQLINDYGQIFAAVLPKLKPEDALLEIIWQQPYLLPVVTAARLQATLSALSAGLSEADLAGELSAELLEQDYLRLKTYERVYREMKLDAANDMAEVAHAVSACAKTASLSMLEQACSRERLASFATPWREYLQRAQFNAVLKAVSQSDRYAHNFKLLAETEALTLRTPATHDVVLLNLRHLLTQGGDVQYEVAGSKRSYLLLTQFGRHDERIAELLAEFFVYAAKEAFRRGNLPESVRLAEFAISWQPRDGVNEEFARFLPRLQRSLALGNNTALLERTELLADALKSRGTLGWGIGLILLVCVGPAVFYLFWKRRSFFQVKAPQPLGLTSPERQELRDLLEFFKLPQRSKGLVPDDAVLSHRYRDLAKTFHPDAGGSLRGFVELNEKYERTKRLISKLH